jgi:hypothetical protein
MLFIFQISYTSAANLVTTGISLPAKAILNARLGFCVSKPTKNVFHSK